MIDNSKLLKLVFLILTLLITLIFGLYPKDFGSEHTPFLNSDGDLSFTKYSVATTQVKLPQTPDHSKQADKLTLDVRLKIPKMPDIINGFSIIFSINDAQGNSQILLGQWEHYLVVMSGDDYANQNNQPRITIPLDLVDGYHYPQPVHVQIEATATNTRVTVNQQTMAQSSDFIVPFQQNTFTVSLGNTLNRKQGWIGTLSEFELDFFRCPSEDSAAIDSRCPSAYTINLYDVAHNPPIASDSHRAWTLQSPYKVLSTEWLSTASLKYWKTPAFYRDVVINLFGFVPVTLAIFIALAARYPLPATAVATITVAILISLFIESVQIFLPSRTSSIVDLLVNSLAGILTTLLCYLVACAMRRKA